MTGPNVLLIVFDTARADVFEPYGAPTGSTPATAQLASAGHAAPLAFSPACWTIPSHVSMFTGLLPRSAGLARGAGGDPAFFRSGLTSHAERMLPEVLRRHGWGTAGVSANLWVSAKSGFDTGFSHFETVQGDRSAHLGTRSLKKRTEWALEALRARVDDGAAALERLLEGWLTSRDDSPFFWFVNLVECHSPYLPPAPYNDLGPLERIRAAEDCHRYQTFVAFSQACLGGLTVPEPALVRMRHLYGRSIALLDDWLARVLEELDRAGVLDETLVIVTSDHGENLGEGGLTGHAFSLDDRLIRVPLVAAGPGAHAFADDRPLSLAELPRLVAGICDIDDHPWTEPLPEGAAVAQFDAPVDAGDDAVAELVEKFAVPAHGVERLTTSVSCATDGHIKLVRRLGREEVVDIAADPLELAPRPVTPDDEAGPMAERLKRLRAALDLAASTERASGPGANTGHRPEDDDLAARMELLGYL